MLSHMPGIVAACVVYMDVFISSWVPGRVLKYPTWVSGGLTYCGTPGGGGLTARSVVCRDKSDGSRN